MKRPFAVPHSNEPGSLPVEPDLGPVPVLVPEQRDKERVACPSVQAHSRDR